MPTCLPTANETTKVEEEKKIEEEELWLRLLDVRIISAVAS